MSTIYGKPTAGCGGKTEEFPLRSGCSLSIQYSVITYMGKEKFYILHK